MLKRLFISINLIILTSLSYSYADQGCGLLTLEDKEMCQKLEREAAFMGFADVSTYQEFISDYHASAMGEYEAILPKTDSELLDEFYALTETMNVAVNSLTYVNYRKAQLREQVFLSKYGMKQSELDIFVDKLSFISEVTSGILGGNQTAMNDSVERITVRCHGCGSKGLGSWSLGDTLKLVGALQNKDLAFNELVHVDIEDTSNNKSYTAKVRNRNAWMPIMIGKPSCKNCTDVTDIP